MVYCGKPSKACAECRLRRTRCDLLRPSCSQCIRAGRKCTGYRDSLDVLFRNQTSEFTGQKASTSADENTRALARPTIKHPNTTKSTSFDPSIKWGNTWVDNDMSLSLGTSPEDQATCFFFKNYVPNDQLNCRGTYHYLPDVYSREIIGSSLGDVVVALGTVGLANMHKDSRLGAFGERKYNLALNSVSKRLRDMEMAKEDQTLITVLLLGLYETNTCSSPKSMEAWTKHVSGAAALLQLRGKEQLLTTIGHELFMQIRGQVITNCIQRRAAVPPTINEWSEYALPFETPEEVSNTQLCLLFIKFANLRATMTHFNDFTSIDTVLPGLCEVDTELTSWAANSPIKYIYQTITMDTQCEEVFSDHYHLYEDVWKATVWNSYRSVRILINELIVNLLTHLCESAGPFDLQLYHSQIQVSTSTVLLLTHEICASVPFFLGHKLSNMDPGTAATTTTTTTDPVKAVSGNLLLWPLYVAACTDMVSPMMRKWVAGRLRVIAEVMGIKQAKPLADFVMLQTDIDRWPLEYQGHSGLEDGDGQADELI